MQTAKENYNTIELQEIAISCENKIRYELQKADTIKECICYGQKDKEDYRPCKSIVYTGHIVNKRESIVYSEIKSESNNIYIENNGKYQLANFIDKMLVIESKEDDIEYKYLDIKLVMILENTKYIHKFRVYK